MQKNQQGFAILYLTLLVVFVLSGIGASSFLLTSSQQRIVENTKESLQAYYGAEAGVEDALFRTKNALSWSNPVTLSVLGAQVTTTITEDGATRTVRAEGNDSSRIRKVQALYQQGTTPQFFYGAHVGKGGLVMDNNSQVVGNVFSNGNAVGSSGTVITNTILVAGSGGTLKDIAVQGDAFVNECGEGSQIGGTLHTNENNGCSFGALETLGTPPGSVPLPITTEHIQQWKDEAEAGGTSTGNITFKGSDTALLGPQKIVGNVTVEDSAVLTLAGTLWVTGKVDIKNSAQVRLDASYGAASGVLVADGVITLENNSVSSGSGTQGSYLMYLSTNTGNPAFNSKNNAVADILYASAGWIVVENNNEVREVTGYGVHLKNNATVIYEAGLLSSYFTSGPGLGWELVSWKEVE